MERIDEGLGMTRSEAVARLNDCVRRLIKIGADLSQKIDESKTKVDVLQKLNGDLKKLTLSK